MRPILCDWEELRNNEKDVIELLVAECLTRATLDSIPSREELRERFPDVHERIDLTQIERQARDEQERKPTASRIDSPFTPDSLPASTLGKSHDSSRARKLEPLPDVADPISVGTHFGRYEILERIGSGAMGVVYRAHDMNLERDVALKVPHVDPSSDITMRERFAREARAAGAIRHPNVYPIFDVGVIDGIYYISMALVRGKTLGNWIKERTPSPPDAAKYVRKIASALSAVHEAGIAHRDIKPSNVMIDEHGEILLMDFGMARHGDAEV